MKRTTKKKRRKKEPDYLYHFYYDRYKIELAESDRLYARCHILLIMISTLCLASVKLGQIALLDKIFSEIDVFLYWMFLITSFVCFGISAVYAFLCLRPTDKFRGLSSLVVFKDYREWLSNESKNMELLYSNLAESQTVNSLLNEKRRRYFKKAFLAVAVGVIPLLITSLFYVFLSYKELKKCVIMF